MKLHKKEMFLSLLSLVIGLVIYIFFRKGTYIHTLLKINDSYSLARSDFLGHTIIKYYLPDFLWAFSLTNALIAVSEKKKKEVLIIGLIVLLLSLLWEVLQLLKIVSGTFDFLDCFIYLLAVIAAVVLAAERKRR